MRPSAEHPLPAREGAAWAVTEEWKDQEGVNSRKGWNVRKVRSRRREENVRKVRSRRREENVRKDRRTSQGHRNFRTRASIPRNSFSNRELTRIITRVQANRPLVSR